MPKFRQIENILSHAYFLPTILCLGFLLRLCVGLVYGQFHQLPDYFTQYQKITTILVNTGTYVDTRPPGYILMLAPFFYIFRAQHLLPAIIGQCILGTAFIYLIYKSGVVLFNETAGRISALIAAFYPWLIYYASQLSVEHSTAFWVSLSLYMLITYDTKTSFWKSLLTGLVLGYTAAVRSMFLMFTIPVIILVWIYKKATIRQAAITFAGLLIIVLSWTACNGLVHHTWSFTGDNADHNLYLGLNPDNKTGGAIWGVDAPTLTSVNATLAALPPAEAKTWFRRQVWTFVTTQPSAVAKLTTKKMFIFWRPYPRAPEFTNVFTILAVAGTFIPVVLLAIFGVIRTIRSKSFYKISYILFYILFLNCIHLIFAASLVYRFPIEPLLIMLAGGGFYSLLKTA